MNPGTTPAEAAYEAYIKALPPLTDWNNVEQTRREHRQLDSDEHLVEGMKIVLRLGQLARAAMEADGQSERGRLRFEEVLCTFSDDFDHLMERYNAMHCRCGKSARAC